jgi:hypothetical protein
MVVNLAYYVQGRHGGHVLDAIPRPTAVEAIGLIGEMVVKPTLQ